MTSIGDGQFHEGQPVWVIEPDGSQRPANFVGEGEMSAWLGGSPTVLVVCLDTQLISSLCDGRRRPEPPASTSGAIAGRGQAPRSLHPPK